MIITAGDVPNVNKNILQIWRIWITNKVKKLIDQWIWSAQSFIYLLLSVALRSNAADYVLPLFIFFIYFFLFNARSQKLPDRFSPNFQELCILV